MARSVRHLTEIVAQLEERGIDTQAGHRHHHPAGRFTFHVLGAMDGMFADLISEGAREGLESGRVRGLVGGCDPKLTARQSEVARGMYDETPCDGRRKYTVAEIAYTFGGSQNRLPALRTTRWPPPARQEHAAGRSLRAACRAAAPNPCPHQ